MRITHGLLPHVICSFLLLTAAANASARGPYWDWFGEIDDIEFATWPPYCKAKAARGGQVSKAEVARWKRYFGSTYSHIHHYCKGLLWKLRSGRPSWIASQRYPLSFILRRIPPEINYTWSRLPPTNPMYGKMGAELLLSHQDVGNLDKAKTIMDTLFQIRPQDRYTYTGAADFYRKQDDLTKAIEILELGAGKVKKNKRILADLAQDYFDLKQYEKSRQYARLARSKGMKLVRLGRELSEVGFPIPEK